MRPQNKILNQGDLFRAKLEAILNQTHPLFKLSNCIDWKMFEREFGEFFVADFGRPALSIRLVIGLHYLKHLYCVSDEGVVEMFLENPYWQYFCGLEFFEHNFPCNPTSLVKWRKRVGADGIEKLLKETIDVARRSGQLKDIDFERVNVDTTVQEKAISFPTDSRLYQKREDSNKLYSIHAPEVECISKGKIHKKYEFGCKTAIVTTSKKCWVVGINAIHGNPFDGHTLKASINQMEKLTEKRPSHIFVDKGYRGSTNWPQDAQVFFIREKTQTLS